MCYRHINLGEYDRWCPVIPESRANHNRCHYYVTGGAQSSLTPEQRTITDVIIILGDVTGGAQSSLTPEQRTITDVIIILGDVTGGAQSSLNPEQTITDVIIM